jgi:hypothetical protein
MPSDAGSHDRGVAGLERGDPEARRLGGTQAVAGTRFRSVSEA